MNLLTRIMSYDKTKIKNQENCNCEECVSVENVELENQTVEYPKLSEEEIEKIISERYSDKDDKTKTFIRKALIKHGDRYDYSNVTYVKATVNVEIICRVEGHKPFPQTPNNHLSGKGCKICGIKTYSNKHKITFEEFIKRANNIHNYKYDYSKVKYVNNDTNVIIICHNHDIPFEFKQKPIKHLQGQGCPICNNRLMNTKIFIEKANKIHGVGKYDYSKVNYVNAHAKIIIICPKHGEFFQAPNNHLMGENCPECGNEIKCEKLKLTLDEFIEKSSKIHGVGRYDYSKVNYINNSIKVCIICHNHDAPFEFMQMPNAHLMGNGCPKCKNNYKGEIAIRNFLTEYKIEFKEQKRFDDCKDSNTLPFDFYLPQYNLCIEFDGIQHFKPIKRSKTMTDEQAEKNLKYTQNHDNIKTKYCKNNGIDLLRIRYDENVEEKLTQYFQNHKIIKINLF